MTNKCLLSLLMVISITTLCSVKAEGRSCYEGVFSKGGLESGPIEIKKCPNDTEFGCYRYENDDRIDYGCLDNEQFD